MIRMFRLWFRQDEVSPVLAAQNIVVEAIPFVYSENVVDLCKRSMTARSFKTSERIYNTFATLAAVRIVVYNGSLSVSN